MKVVKFGGSSLSTAENILRAKSIVEADPRRTFVVVSAPGKGPDFSCKVTDLLIDAHTELCVLGCSDKSDSLQIVLERFRKLSEELHIDIRSEIERTREEIFLRKCNYDFIISRGEYLMAVLFSKLLGYRFLDAAHCIVIKQNGTVNEDKTKERFASYCLKNQRYVMPGFYGQGNMGSVKTFARGGSDYSGAIAAVMMNASLYENFTDTYGVQTANPVLVQRTKTVPMLDLKTMYKLSVAGASVIYPNCLPLLRRASTPLKVDNTFDPEKHFTQILPRISTNNKYFSITYKYAQNINKDTAQILVVHNKIAITFPELKHALQETEVYLVKFEKCSFTLLAPEGNLKKVVNLLHELLAEK